MCVKPPIVHDLEGEGKPRGRKALRDSGNYHNSWARVVRMRSDCQQHLKMRVPLADFEVTDLMNWWVGEESTVEDGVAIARLQKGFLWPEISELI